MTWHVLSSHNMSVESIRDILCLGLRFMSGLLLARVFRRKWSLLVSCKQTHAAFAFTRTELLLLGLCLLLSSSLFSHSIRGGYLWTHTHTHYVQSGIQHSQFFFTWYIASMWCITVRGLQIVASGADDIINDKSGFCSTSAVVNASLYNVYYLWFGPGVRLHLGMVRNSFLELSIKDLHVKNGPKLDRYK